MKKSDLRSGMIVEMRNGNQYVVFMGTGLGHDQENVFVANDGGWMSFYRYDEDLRHVWSDELKTLNSMFGDWMNDSELDEWDIVKVYAPKHPTNIGELKDNKVIFEREDK